MVSMNAADVPLCLTLVCRDSSRPQVCVCVCSHPGPSAGDNLAEHTCFRHSDSFQSVRSLPFNSRPRRKDFQERPRTTHQYASVFVAKSIVASSALSPCMLNNNISTTVDSMTYVLNHREVSASTRENTHMSLFISLLVPLLRRFQPLREA